MHLSTSFYGSKRPATSPLQDRILNEMTKTSKTRISEADINPYKRSILETKPKTYKKQHDALTYLHSMRDDALRVFSFEEVGCKYGNRSYHVSNLAEFWHYYWHISGRRHFYELIMNNSSCRLYFDLEFYKVTNPIISRDANEVLIIFIDYIIDCLKTDYGFIATRKNIIDLDASNNEKFSHHLIFHLSKNEDVEYLFANNLACGSFVQRSMANLRALDNETTSKLVVRNKHDDGDVNICDMGVYTKNRNFRLYLSSKANDSNRVFRLAETCEYFDERQDTEEFHKRVFTQSLIVPPFDKKRKNKILPEKDSEHTMQSRQNYYQVKAKSTNSNFNETSTSDHPHVDEYVKTMLRLVSQKGFIRAWRRIIGKNNDGHGLLIYDIGGYRYCYNIDRQHKSNHIMWIVDLDRQVWYQKCQDPDCRAIDYRSNEFPMPKELVEQRKEKIQITKETGQEATVDYGNDTTLILQSDTSFLELSSSEPV